MMSFSAQGILGDQFRANCITCMSPEQIEHLEALLRGRKLSWYEVKTVVWDIIGPRPCLTIEAVLTMGQPDHDSMLLRRHFQKPLMFA